MDPAQPSESFIEKHKGLYLLNISAFLIFLSFTVIRSVGEYPGSDSVISFAHFVDSQKVVDLMIGVSRALEPTTLIALSVVAALMLFMLKRAKWAIFFSVTVVGAVLSGMLLKSLFQIARPVDSIISEIGFGFPSIHATAAAVFFYSLSYMIKRKIHDHAVLFLWVLVSIGMVLLVGVSRVYLGVHFITDVLAGFSLGVWWVSLAALMLEYIETRGKNLVRTAGM